MDSTNGGERGKVPMPIVTKDRQLFTYAGLWDMWRDQEAMTYTRSRSSLPMPMNGYVPFITECL